MTKPTKWYVHPAKTQISLGIRPVWSESSQMPRLICLLGTRHFVGFIMRQLVSFYGHANVALQREKLHMPRQKSSHSSISIPWILVHLIWRRVRKKHRLFLKHSFIIDVSDVKNRFVYQIWTRHLLIKMFVVVVFQV